MKICKEGETAVRVALHELIDERYVYLEKLPPNYSKSGRFEYVYHIYEIPYENSPDGLECPELFLKKQSETNQNADVPNTEKQDAENLYLESQNVENQGQLNTYISSAHNAIVHFRIFQINLIVLQILQMLLVLVYLS